MFIILFKKCILPSEPIFDSLSILDLPMIPVLVKVTEMEPATLPLNVPLKVDWKVEIALKDMASVVLVGLLNTVND